MDKSSVARLNAGEEKMEDILVLHLTGGKDSFVSFGPEIFYQTRFIFF